MSFQTPCLHRITRDFAKNETGAVTVDYAVITAAVCGLCLAFSDNIMNAFGVFSGTVEGELSGQTVASQNNTLSYDDGFDNGAEGWSGAVATNVHGAGNVLGPIGGSTGQSVSRTFEVSAEAEQATFSFDVLSFDGLNGESGNVYVNGSIVGTVTTTNGNSVFTANDSAEGISVSGGVVNNSVQIGGFSLDETSGMDSRTQVTITMDNSFAGEAVTVGFGSTADGGVETESFAIDNFTATGLNNPAAAPQV